MDQKTPKISDSDIKRIAERDFPQCEFSEISHVLSMYKSGNTQGEYRVYAAVLKLANGNIEMLRGFVEKANEDFRDIISLAEYPKYSKHGFDEDLSMEKEKQLIDNDWAQYEAWFNKL